MARRTKQVQIDKKTYTVNELSTRQIRNILDSVGDISLESTDNLLAMGTDVTVADIEEMAPSEIKTLWEAFAEVNSDFLYVVKKALKRPDVIKTIDRLIDAALTDALQALLSAVTPTPSITDTDSSAPAMPESGDPTLN